MRITRSPGLLLLAIWLILNGLISLIGLRIPNAATIMGLLALLAGVLILVDR